MTGQHSPQAALGDQKSFGLVDTFSRNAMAILGQTKGISGVITCL